MEEKHPHNHYVLIDENRCNGCVLCMKACPTKAIRVRNGLAYIEGECIYCGECIRICPKRAIKAVTTGKEIADLSRYAIISVSPVFCAQFGRDILPNSVLLALKKIFKYVYDQGVMDEILNVVTELYLEENRMKDAPVFPLISPHCPVVNRIIAHRFPSLFDRILPIIRPREATAKLLKKRLYAEGISEEEGIGIYHISPCAADMIAVKDPLIIEKSYLDGIIGVNEAFAMINPDNHELDDAVMLHRSSGVGMGWCMSGGEIAGLNPGKYLAVSGIQETITYLEKIESGLLKDVEYIEFRTCPEGCIGGPMVAVDRYQAKYKLQRLVRMFGVEKRVQFNEIKKAYKDGWFLSRPRSNLLINARKSLSFAEAFQRQGRIESILKQLPGKECGACGSPDCQTFAEDVVDGRNHMENCVFYHFKENADKKSILPRKAGIAYGT